jgi:hypothetical protein
VRQSTLRKAAVVLSTGRTFVVALPYLTPEQADRLSMSVAEYITVQRERYRHNTLLLSTVQKRALAGFFSLDLLQSTRFVVLRDERVATPEFYPALKAMGFNNLPDPSIMAAITFVDTVVSHEPLTDGLVFHELVHVEQYRQLGVSPFSSLYVRGFLSAGSYEAIPLERHAYALEERFEGDRTDGFSVADRVAEFIAAQRY